jgi:4-hydroxy-3-polyprenylbenzoate decarboxylase
VTAGFVVGPQGQGASRGKAAPRRLVVGISGASGAVYGVELLRALQRAREEGRAAVEGMVIVPCSIKTLSGIVGSFSTNLLLRAADVTLKEGRRLILLVRETPLHKGHLRLMAEAADLGAVIMPPVPAFYHRRRTIEDLVAFTVGRVLDHLGIDHDLYRRWGTAIDME